jgi:hypothetical protein
MTKGETCMQSRSECFARLIQMSTIMQHFFRTSVNLLSNFIENCIHQSQHWLQERLPKKTTLVAICNNVGLLFQYEECNKWRLLFCNRKLNHQEVTESDRARKYLDAISYTCGGNLTFQEGWRMSVRKITSVMITRKDLRTPRSKVIPTSTY